MEMQQQTAQRLSDSISFPDPQAHELPAPYGWIVRLEFTTAQGASYEFHLRDAVELGTSSESAFSVDLTPYGAKTQGVSRRHLRLEPNGSRLHITDLGSTNGSRLNDRPLSPHLTYTLADGDVVSLGSMEFVIRLEPAQAPSGEYAMHQVDLADALAIMAKAITSQLDFQEILGRALELAMSLTSAGEATIWLVDVKTNELFLEAECGLEDDQIRWMRLPVTDTQAGQVVATGHPLRASRAAEGEQVKVKTGYVVEAVLYVPLKHGDTTFGVMSVVHRTPGKVFSIRDEKLLTTMADFVAIAIHNARLYQTIAEADRLKGEMIQNISHEFRTPLTYIVGYTGLLLDETTLPPNERESLEVIAQQANKLSRMVENFVSIEAAERDAQHRDVVDVAALLHRSASGCRLLAAEQGIRVTVDVSDDLRPVLANEMAITQVMDNLISNALKFTPHGGEVRMGAVGSAEHVVIAVSDSGIGIPEDAQGRIFERFYQVDGSTTRRYGGVGLGLFVCKEIIEAHGGQIWLESEPGCGTTFYFSVPVAQS